MLMYSKINYFLSANSTRDKRGLEEITFRSMYTNNQEDNAASILMRIWSLNRVIEVESI